jgi:hypothetical protein
MCVLVMLLATSDLPPLFSNSNVAYDATICAENPDVPGRGQIITDNSRTPQR